MNNRSICLGSFNFYKEINVFVYYTLWFGQNNGFLPFFKINEKKF